MNRKALIGVIVVILLVVGFAGYVIWGRMSGGTASVPTAGPAKDLSNLTVPGAGATNVPAGVAVPQTVLPAGGAATTVSARDFNLNIGGGSFNPNTVVVKQGDSITIRFTAQDKAYDVYQPEYGWNLSIPRGTTKVLGFDAVQAGSFKFYCQSCGGPDSGPVGYLNVVPK